MSKSEIGVQIQRLDPDLPLPITLVNTPGIIDSGYRGELKVVMINTDPELDYEVKRGDRVAQLIISRYDNVTWTEVTELSGFDRGGGFGHSGR